MHNFNKMEKGQKLLITTIYAPEGREVEVFKIIKTVGFFMWAGIERRFNIKTLEIEKHANNERITATLPEALPKGWERVDLTDVGVAKIPLYARLLAEPELPEKIRKGILKYMYITPAGEYTLQAPAYIPPQLYKRENGGKYKGQSVKVSNCATCGKETLPSRSRINFCSGVCAKKWIDSVPTIGHNVCRVCGKGFEAKSKRQKACSSECHRDINNVKVKNKRGGFDDTPARVDSVGKLRQSYVFNKLLRGEVSYFIENAQRFPASFSVRKSRAAIMNIIQEKKQGKNNHVRSLDEWLQKHTPGTRAAIIVGAELRLTAEVLDGHLCKYVENLQSNE